MNKLTQILIPIIILLFSFNVFAAASDDVKTSSADFETTAYEDEIYDPLEGINRAVFKFNNVADKVIALFSLRIVTSTDSPLLLSPIAFLRSLEVSVFSPFTLVMTSPTNKPASSAAEFGETS